MESFIIFSQIAQIAYFLDYTTLLCTGFAIKLSDDVATDGFCPIIFLN